MRMNSAGVNFVSYSYRFYHSMYVAIKTCMQVCQRSVVDYIEEDQIVSIASSTSLWHLDSLISLWTANSLAPVMAQGLIYTFLIQVNTIYIKIDS